MTETLFDKYGGFDTFRIAVTSFYQKVLASEHLKPYFKGINMEALISHQIGFISKILGGPDQYEGRDLKTAHAKLNITVPDFDEIAGLLKEALSEAGLEEADVETVILAVASLQGEIVSE